MTTIKVVCTGRGTHKRRVFNEITATPEGLHCNTHRVANFAEAKGVYDDGAEVVAKAVMPASYDPRDGGRWRWRCAVCGADRRFTDQGLRDWVNTAGRVADISAL
jgi:hypothetical protein